MGRAYLILPAAALVLAACASPPGATTSHHPARSPATVGPPAGLRASLSPGPLIADTAMDVATCRQFASEQAGQLSAAEFNVWLLRHGGQTTIGPASATGMDDTLSTTLADWYVVQAAGPSGDLQSASYYAAQVGAECVSIGA